MKANSGKPERGQILVVAAFAFAALLGMAAVVIDLGNGMLEKRRLQHTTDAAALAAAREIVFGGSETAARNVANGIILQSTGNAVSLPATNEGSGVGLVNGIEFYYNDTWGLDSVRVALRRSVPTFLAGVLGADIITVGTQSRAGMTAAGVLPVTAKRYDNGNPHIAIGSAPNPSAVTDYLRREGSATISSWGDHFASPPSNVVATLDYPGPVMPFTGVNAQPTVPGGDGIGEEANNFRGVVNPYVRDLTSWSPEFIDPAHSSMSGTELRGLARELFTHKIGYTALPAMPNQELLALGGTDSGDTVSAMRVMFPPDSYVIAMVYDGVLYKRPSFNLTMNSPAQIEVSSLPEGTEGSPPVWPAAPVEFTMRLTPDMGFGGNVVMYPNGLDTWEGEHIRWRFCVGSDCSGVNSTRTVPLYSFPVTVKLQIWWAKEVGYSVLETAPTGARTITVEAWSTGSASRFRTALAGIRVGPGFLLWSTATTRTIVPGSSGTASYTVDVTPYGGYNIGGVGAPTPVWMNLDGSYTSQPWGINQSVSIATIPGGKRVTFTVDAPGAAALGMWKIKLVFAEGQSIMLTLVSQYSSNLMEQNNNFVRLLGYAAFKVHSYDGPNKSYVQAVSGLYSDPNEIGLGMTVRLIGWSQ
jgi:hypothetical protein